MKDFFFDDFFFDDFFFDDFFFDDFLLENIKGERGGEDKYGSKGERGGEDNLYGSNGERGWEDKYGIKGERGGEDNLYGSKGELCNRGGVSSIFLIDVDPSFNFVIKSSIDKIPVGSPDIFLKFLYLSIKCSLYMSFLYFTPSICIFSLDLAENDSSTKGFGSFLNILGIK